MKKVIFSIVSLLLIVMVSACGEAEIEIESDGSGSVEVVLPEMNHYSADDIRAEIEHEKEQGDWEGISGVSVRESNEMITVNLSFDHLTYLHDGLRILPLGDFEYYYPGIMDELTVVNDELSFEEDSEMDVLLIPSNMMDFEGVTIQLPGDLAAYDGSLTMESSDVIHSSSRGDLVLVYDHGSEIPMSMIILPIILLAGGGYVLYRKKQANVEEKQQVVKEDDQVAQ